MLGDEKLFGIGNSTPVQLFMSRQLALVGKPYDWTNIIRIAEKKKKKVNKKYYCSELVNYGRDNWYTDGDDTKQIMPHELVKKEPNLIYRIKHV